MISRKMFILFFMLLPGIYAHAQQRGLKPVRMHIGNEEIELYKESHALVLGMSQYTKWPKLPGVQKDVQAVKKILEQNGFNVVVKQDLDKSQVDEEMTSFIGKYGQDANNRLLFYFAGHGHTIQTNFGEVIGFIVPVDAPNPNFDKTGFQAASIPMSRIEEYARLTESKHAMFLFDACFSGSIFALSRAVPEVISYKTSKPVRQFITSGSEDENVPDKSIFRELFVDALTTNYADANKDGYLTGTELGKFLQDNVVNYSRNNQHPQYRKIRNKYLDKGDFVFVLNTAQQKQQELKTPQLGNESSSGKTRVQPSLGQAKSTLAYGSIVLDTEIGGGLSIDGKSIGTVEAYSKVPVKDVLAGNREFMIQGEGETWQQTIDVEAEKTKTVTVKSSIRYGSIRLETGLTGTLYLNGQRLGQVQANTEVPVDKVPCGKHSLEIRGRENWTATVKVEENKESHIVAKSKDLPLPGNLVFIEGGSFTMGCTDEQGSDCDDDEKPAHKITLSDFYIGKYEVTFAEYDKFCGATGRSKPDDEGWGRGNRPVINVSWHDAVAYCKWLSEETGRKYRLPTEAEWEYAARGGASGSATKYAGTSSTSQLSEYGNYCDSKCSFGWADKNNTDGYKLPAPVGRFKRNELGIYDMSGNVYEWCSDRYDSDYYGSSPRNNPTGPSSGPRRVLRGGSWNNYAMHCRVANRYYYSPGFSDFYFGFRVVQVH